MLDSTEERLTEAATRWLGALQQASSHDDVARLFLGDSYWRDAVGLTWDLQTIAGQAEIGARLSSALNAGHAAFRIDRERPPAEVVRVDTLTIEAFFTFETATGRGEGILRLCEDDDGTLRAWTFLTALRALASHEEKTGANRPTGKSYARDFRGPNWLDERRSAIAYADRDPAVLIVGGGQAGLSIAARLSQLGVDALIIDRHPRIGDNWRKRYHALTLHNQVQVNHLPYMPFPPNWPTYIPKDKLANWFEAYVESLELNYWTSTVLISGRYNEAEGRWTAELRRDGADRTLHPRHIVMATGVSGIPSIPQLPGLEDFAGQVVHSSAYDDGEDWAGKRAIVIGTGNSGHDISQDLCSSGANVVMVQRSPSMVVNIEPSAQLPYSLYDQGLPMETCDLIVASMPVPLTRRAHVSYTRRAREMDRQLLDRLEARGFKLDYGEDETGWQFKYLTRGGGYYFNVGCSDMIADGRIDLIQFEDIERFGP
ncbi:MAG: NAD(P)/FAD-dependent oxidoreductase, partial [Pseudomonadota bacterium]